MKAKVRPPSPSTADKAKHTILIVDDHSVVREGLAAVINDQPDLVVCGQAENAGKALIADAALKPDLVIVDISLEGRNGLDLIKDLRVQRPKRPIMALSMHDETLYAERALRAGAQGYVMKKEATKDLLAALRRVLAGGVYLSERMTGKMMHQFVQGVPAKVQSSIELLSDRELEVFQLLGQGCSTRMIAVNLHISIKTVSSYRQNIMLKLNLTSSSALVHHAIHWAKSNQAD
jgi:DNA-binding NarL/FixJ family response regulator